MLFRSQRRILCEAPGTGTGSITELVVLGPQAATEATVIAIIVWILQRETMKLSRDRIPADMTIDDMMRDATAETIATDIFLGKRDESRILRILK